MALTNKLKSIADAIRGKTGKSEPLTLDQMAEEITSIEVGGGEDEIELLCGQELTEYVNDSLMRINAPCFHNQTNLTKVSLPNCIFACGKAFYECTKLTDVNLPKLESCQNNVFRNNSSLVSISLPGHSGRIDASAFEGCTKLERADFAYINEKPAIQSYAFGNCKALVTLIIRNTDVVPGLQVTSAFAGTPILSGTGYIYVPAAMIEAYQAATNWSTFGEQFRAIEDYPEICGEVTE